MTRLKNAAAIFFSLLFPVLAHAANVDLGVSAYTWSPDPVIRGGNSTFSINVTNNDSGTQADNLTLAVELPPNVDFSGSTPPANCAFNLSASPKTLTCTRASLAAQGVWNTSFAGVGLTTAVQQTKATISAAGNTDPNSGNDDLIKNTTVINGADLAVTKTGVSSCVTATPCVAAAGANYTYTLHVANNGPDLATTFRVVDNLPAAVDFTYSNASGSGWSCGVAGTTLTCDYAGTAVASGAAAGNITLTGRIITTSGTITNGATVSSTDPSTADWNSGNDTSSVVVTVTPGTDLRANKTMNSVATGTTSYATNESVNLVLSATNTGTQNATGVTVTDTVPSDLTIGTLPAGCSKTGQAITCTVGNLAFGATSSTFTIPLTATGAAGNSGTNTANVTRTTPAGGTNTPASVNYSIAAPTANLTVTKTMVSSATGMTTIATGEAVTLRLRVRNNGPQSATGVTVVDTVPSDFILGTMPAGCAKAGNVITCTAGSLASGASSSNFVIPLTAGATLNPAGSNTATSARSTPAAGTNGSATANYTIVDPFSHLTLTKTKGPTPVLSGANISNTITVTNSMLSTSATTGTIRVTDTLGSNETYVSASAGWVCSGVSVGATGTLTCDYAIPTSLARGSSVSLVITTKATNTIVESISNNACTGLTASSPHIPADNDATGNCQSASVTGTIYTSNLSITKTADIPASLRHVLISDNSVVYTLVVSNAGELAPTVNVSDAIPNWMSGTSGSAVISSAVAGESCSFGATVNCTLLNVANGTPRTITITVTRPFGIGSLTNTASASTPNAINGTVTGSADIIVDPIADVAVTAMTSTPNPVKVGVQLSYTTSIKNNGPDAAAGVVLRQPIDPARMSYVAGSASLTVGGSCSYVASYSGAPYAGQSGIECSGFSMPNGQSRQLTFKVIPIYPYPDALDATYTSSATITTTTVESDSVTGYANNTNTNNATVTTKALDLTVTDNDPGYDPTPFGDKIIYAVAVQNNGPSQATGFKLTVTPVAPAQGTQPLPYTMTYNAAGSTLPAGATCSLVGSDVVCYMGADQASSVLAAGTPKNFSLQFDTGPVSNTPAGSVTYKTISSVESYETGSAPFTGDTLAGNNSVTETTTVLPKTDLRVISKSVSPASPFSLNQPFTYSIVVADMGPSPAAGVKVTDVLPSGLSVTGPVTATLGNGSLTTNSCVTTGAAATGITVTCTLGTLPVAANAGDTNNLVTISIPVKAAYGTYLASHGFNTNRANTASIAVLTVSGVPLSYDPDNTNNTSNTVNVQIQKSSIAGSVYSDTNQNNTLDAGEKITSSVTFSLYGKDAWGNDIGTAGSPITLSTSTGNFLFDNLPTADATGYTVIETQPSAYYDRFEVLGTWAGAVLPDTGVKPADTCDGSANCSSSAASNTFNAIVLPQNTAATGYLFQEYRQATIAGHVYKDMNNDGNRSGASETDITGVQVKISGSTFWGADVCTLLGAACTQTTTGSGYSFTIPPSDGSGYTVAEQSQPATYFDGQDQNGTGTGNVIASSAGRVHPESIAVGTVAPNANLTERNFGELPPSTLSGSVFVDTNSNGTKEGGETGGVPNVTVTLAGTDYLGRDICTVLPSCTFTTDSSGNYSITGLPPGTYSLTETPPPGMTHTGAQAGSAGGTGGGSAIVAITNVVIGANVTATGYNFGEFGQALSGYVYVDLNRNGVKDSGEPGVAGVSMTLSGTTIGSADVCSAIAPNPCTVVTASDGGYSFASLPESNASGYTIAEQSQASTPLTNYQDGQESVGTVNSVVTGSAAVNDRISGIMIPVGQAGSNYNFGEQAGSIAGRVYYDSDDNGAFNGSDSGISGVTLTLSGTTASGANVCSILASCSVTSQADGTFTLIGLPASNGSGYTLTEVQPVDYANRTTSAGSLGATTTTGTTATGIVLNPGINATGYLFGEKTGALSGKVYLDINNNGVVDSGETGIAGVVLTLSGSTASGAPACSTCTATTAADGSYSFTGLKNANGSGYSITETQPGIYADGKETAGLQGGTVDNASFTSNAAQNRVTAIAFSAASAATGYNFGEVQVGSIAGRVYHDLNNNGTFEAGEAIAGVTLTLSGNDDQNVAVNLTTTTASDGTYSFANLRPSAAGGYTVTETQPTGISDYPTNTGTQVGTIGGSSVGSAGAGANVISGIVLPSNGAGIDYNFREQASSIAGFVYRDDNDNGVKDGSESGLAGITVTLKNAAGTVTIATTTTDANGAYAFNSLPSGTYLLEETPPAGYLDGKETNGSLVGGVVDNTAYDNTAAHNRISNIVLPAGTNATSYLFGERGGSLNGFVYVDANNNGLKDSGETPIQNVQIILSGTVTGGADVCGILPSCTATTNASGAFVFEGVPPGTYTLVENQTAITGAYNDGKETAGVVGGVVDNSGFGTNAGYNTISNIVIDGAGITANAGNIGGYLFGERVNTAPIGLIPPILSGYVYADLSHSRTRPTATPDPLVEGWTVTLTAGKSDGSSEVICTLRTDAYGFYHFDNLACLDNYPQWAGGLPITGAAAGGGTTYTTFSIGFSNPGGNGISTAPQSGGAVGTVDPTQVKITSITVHSGDNITEQNLPLDPSGVVYDAVTRAPVANASVEILFGGVLVPGACLTSGQNTIITGSNGFYEFLLIPGGGCPGSGNYTLRVTPPAGYAPGVSTMIPPTAGPYIPTIGGVDPIQPQPTPPSGAGTTYFLELNLTITGVVATSSSNVVNNHIPIDPVNAGQITVTKTTPLINVSRGDLVPYTITATNNVGANVLNINLRDQIPPGFKYKTGTARLDGVPQEPTVNGRDLTWSNLSFTPNQRRVLNLMLIVGSGVNEGEYVNRAFASNLLTGSAVSNTATATVRVIPDPTFDCSDLIGKVFDDKNANGYQDDGEPGIANVRLATVNGLLVTTDDQGRFHVTCAMVPNEWRGSNFLMKLDERTLPSGYRVTTENPRDVRLTRGKMSKLNFGATIHKVVRVDVTDAAFEGDTLKPEWASQFAQLPDLLKDRPAILRLAYQVGAEGADQAGKRLKTLSAQLRKLWESKQCCHLLQIEEELIQPSVKHQEGR